MQASQNSKYPIVICMFQPCFQTHARLRNQHYFLNSYVIRCTSSPVRKCDERVIVHKQCKIKSLNKSQYIEDLARLCTDHIQH